MRIIPLCGSGKTNPIKANLRLRYPNEQQEECAGIFVTAVGCRSTCRFGLSPDGSWHAHPDVHRGSEGPCVQYKNTFFVQVAEKNAMGLLNIHLHLSEVFSPFFIRYRPKNPFFKPMILNFVSFKQKNTINTMCKNREFS